MLAEAYNAKYGVRPRPIHNTYSLNCVPASNHERPLRLYWFSQTLGPGRGLDDVVSAAGRSRIAAELHIRARQIPAYAAQLVARQRAEAPLLKVIFHDPAPPDRMVELARGYDLGLSVEEGEVLNHRLCLGNKIFTYLAAGVPVLMTATPAQARLATDLGAAAPMYDGGDV